MQKLAGAAQRLNWAFALLLACAAAAVFRGGYQEIAAMIWFAYADPAIADRPPVPIARAARATHHTVSLHHGPFLSVGPEAFSGG